MSVREFPLDSSISARLSPDEKYMIYASQSNIVIRSNKSWSILKSIPVPLDLGPWQAKLSWDNKFLLVLILRESAVKIIRLKDDKEFAIKQSELEEIVNFEWLKVSGQYGNGEIIALYSKCGLSLKLYSIVANKVFCIHSIYKNCSKIIKHPSIDQHLVVLKKGIKNILFTFVITLNEVQLVNELELHDNFSDIVVKYSPKNSWILVWDVMSSDLTISIYNFLGLGHFKGKIETGYAFQKFQSNEFSIGATQVEWMLNHKQDEIIVCGDYDENVQVIEMSGDLKLSHTLKHHNPFNNESQKSLIFAQTINSLEYTRRQHALFNLPSEKLELHNKGIQFLVLNETLLAVVTKSMPSVLFLWDWKDLTSPKLVINSQSNIVSVVVLSQVVPRSTNKYINSVIDSMVIINNGFSVTVYSNIVMNVPLVLDTIFEDKVIGIYLTDIVTENGEVYIKLTCWSETKIKLISQSISLTDSSFIDDTSVNEVSMDETSTKVRDIINAVQQSEWLRPSTDISEITDTFLQKKRNLIEDKENLQNLKKRQV